MYIAPLLITLFLLGAAFVVAAVVLESDDDKHKLHTLTVWILFSAGWSQVIFVIAKLVQMTNCQ